MKPTLEELVARCLAARNIARLQHWKEPLLTHPILSDLDEGITVALDDVVENHIGVFEDFLGDVAALPLDLPKDFLTFVQDEASWIETNREALSGGSASVAAQIDILVSVFSRAAYRLRLATPRR